MKAHIAVLLMTALAVSACYRTGGQILDEEKYVDLMSEIACRGLTLASEETMDFLKFKGVSQDQVVEFQNRSTQDTLNSAQLEIMKRAKSCLGTNQIGL